MSDYPEDVMKAARGCIAVLIGGAFGYDKAVSTIASAITAERERANLIENEARFLLARLEEIEIPDDLERDWEGHIAPSISRLNRILSALEGHDDG